MKGFISVLLVVVSSTSILAQEESSINVKGLQRINLVGGPSITSMRYTKLLPIERPGSTIGFGVGLGADYIVNDNFSINGKMFYEKKGGRFNIDAGTYDFVTKMHGVAKGAIHEIDRLDYLTVPIMLNYSLLHKTPLSVGFGPFVSYLLRAQHTEENTIIKQGYIGDFTRNFRRIDLDSRLLLGPISH